MKEKKNREIKVNIKKNNQVIPQKQYYKKNIENLFMT